MRFPAVNPQTQDYVRAGMTKVIKGSVFVGLHFNLVLEKRIQVFTSTLSPFFNAKTK